MTRGINTARKGKSGGEKHKNKENKKFEKAVGETPKSAPPAPGNRKKLGKGANLSFQEFETPRAVKNQKKKIGAGDAPKSAPPAPPKRKKLEEEIDDDLSDEDFEQLLQAFKADKGKGKKKTPKKASSEGDDDLDDSDDDLDEEDDNEDDDDDDDSEGDDESEDDEDESEDDEEEEPVPTPNKKGKTPVKKTEAPSPKKGKTPGLKAETPVTKNGASKLGQKRPSEAVSYSSADVEQALKEQEKLKKERDARTLFMKGLPNNATVNDIKKVSTDILAVRILAKGKKSKQNRGFCFLEFKSEKFAEKNYKILQSAKVLEKDVTVDYLGEKSKTHKKTSGGDDLDPLRLHVSGNEKGTNRAALQKLFPNSVGIDLPTHKNGKPAGYAFVAFAAPADARNALIEMKGQNALNVFYAKKRKDPAIGQKNLKDKTDGPPQKKAKSTKNAAVVEDEKMEEDESDDEDDEDDEDDDDDDDEEDDEEDEDEDDDDDDED